MGYTWDGIQMGYAWVTSGMGLGWDPAGSRKVFPSGTLIILAGGT